MKMPPISWKAFGGERGIRTLPFSDLKSLNVKRSISVFIGEIVKTGKNGLNPTKDKFDLILDLRYL